MKTLYPIWSHLETEFLEHATKLAFVELMLSGCTTTSDHHYLFPDGLENAIDVQADVSQSLGIRSVLTRGSMDLSVEDGALPPKNVVQDTDQILVDCERLISRYHQQGPDSMLQIALAPCSPFSVSTNLMKETAQLAQQADVLLHTHLAETHDEAEFCQQRFGMSPLDYLEEMGWLGDRTWLAHGIHFSDDEIRRIGRSGVAVSSCSHSNMHLSSGICSICALEQAGSSVGLGVDGSASNDGSNMIEEVRQAFLLQRLKYGSAAVDHKDALRWATKGSANCLRRDDLGEIAIGKAADLAFFKLNEPRHSGAFDPLAALVVCGVSKADRLMIAGKWRVQNGQMVDVDLDELMHLHSASARRLMQKAGF